MNHATLDICAAELAYATLRERIINADLLPNTHHLVTALAQELRLPSIDLHNASVQLRDEGLLSLEPRGGFWVAPIDTGATADTFRHVSMLESRAVYIAALHGPTAIGIAALDDAIQSMHDSLFRGDRNLWARACHHFHRSLVQCSGHSDLIAAALAQSEFVHRARMVALAVHGLTPDSVQDRAMIVDAIRRGAALESRDRLVAHWQAEAETVIALLKTHGLDTVMA